MAPWFSNNYLSLVNYLDFLIRIALSLVCGSLIGLEREKRLKNAGIRTHIIVALASTLMMIVSKYGFMDISSSGIPELHADASRIAHGIVSAIGFLGAGVIYIRGENAVGLTTAAGLWATVGIGLAFGAGMYGLGIASTLLILLIQAVLHKRHSKTHSQLAAKIGCNITNHGITVEGLKEYIVGKGMTVRNLKMRKTADGNTEISLNVILPHGVSMEDFVQSSDTDGILDSIDVYPAL